MNLDSFFGLSFEEMAMITFGFVAQGLFAGRFIVQWLKSEIGRKSVVPVAFWYFSLAGGAMMLIYAIWRKDPVFISGQGLGLLIYIRNLWLIHREKREKRDELAAAKGEAAGGD